MWQADYGENCIIKLPCCTNILVCKNAIEKYFLKFKVTFHEKYIVCGYQKVKT